MKLVPYEPWMYELCAFEYLMDAETIKIFSIAYSLRGTSYGIEHDGCIVGCAGIYELWPGVAEAWTLFSQEAKNHPYFIHKMTKRIVHNAAKEKPYHRIHAVVRKNDPIAIRWAERLGFEYESTMKRYGADMGDFDMMVLKEA